MSRTTAVANVPYRWCHLLYCVAAVCAGGCEQSPGIQVQQAPKLVIERDEFPGLDDPQHAILVAMVPVSDETWVFRMFGPLDEVKSNKGTFESFVTTIFVDPGGGTPKWKLPDNWKQETGGSQFRVATIQVPTKSGDSLDLSVSRVSQREDWLHTRLRNFNRWRGQLQLPVATATEMARMTTYVSTAGGGSLDAAVMILEGTRGETQRPSMAMRQSAEQRQRQHTDDSRDSSPAKITFTVPNEWREKPPGRFVRNLYAIERGSKSANVSVSSFGAQSAPSIADPLININRWRVQDLGLPSITSAELAQVVDPIEVGDGKGLFVTFDGQAPTHADKAMRAAMVVSQSNVWFFKLYGDREVVESEAEPFREFLNNIQFK